MEVEGEGKGNECRDRVVTRRWSGGQKHRRQAVESLEGKRVASEAIRKSCCGEPFSRIMSERGREGF